jgi:DNA-binding response OmpR family regulator
LAIIDVEYSQQRCVEIAKALKRQSPPCPVLLLTGENRASQSPPDAFGSVDHTLRKPFQMHQFLNTVALLIAAESPT